MQTKRFICSDCNTNLTQELLLWTFTQRTDLVEKRKTKQVLALFNPVKLTKIQAKKYSLSTLT